MLLLTRRSNRVALLRRAIRVIAVSGCNPLLATRCPTRADSPSPSNMIAISVWRYEANMTHVVSTRRSSWTVAFFWSAGQAAVRPRISHRSSSEP